MSTSDSSPSFSKATSTEKIESFAEVAKSRIKESALITLDPVLVVVRVTIIFTLALLADTCITQLINWSFSDIVNHDPFAAKLLIGIRLLSALGTAVAYIFYLLRSLFKDGKEALEDIRGKEQREEISS